MGQNKYIFLIYYFVIILTIYMCCKPVARGDLSDLLSVNHLSIITTVTQQTTYMHNLVVIGKDRTDEIVQELESFRVDVIHIFQIRKIPAHTCTFAYVIFQFNMNQKT